MLVRAQVMNLSHINCPSHLLCNFFILFFVLNSNKDYIEHKEIYYYYYYLVSRPQVIPPFLFSMYSFNEAVSWVKVWIGRYYYSVDLEVVPIIILYTRSLETIIHVQYNYFLMEALEISLQSQSQIPFFWIKCENIMKKFGII